MADVRITASTPVLPAPLRTLDLIALSNAPPAHEYAFRIAVRRAVAMSGIPAGLSAETISDYLTGEGLTESTDESTDQWEEDEIDDGNEADEWQSKYDEWKCTKVSGQMESRLNGPCDFPGCPVMLTGKDAVFFWHYTKDEKVFDMRKQCRDHFNLTVSLTFQSFTRECGVTDANILHSMSRDFQRGVQRTHHPSTILAQRARQACRDAQIYAPNAFTAKPAGSGGFTIDHAKGWVVRVLNAGAAGLRGIGDMVQNPVTHAEIAECERNLKKPVHFYCGVTGVPINIVDPLYDNRVS